MKLYKVRCMSLRARNAQRRTAMFTIVSNKRPARPDTLIVLAAIDSNVLLKIIEIKLVYTKTVLILGSSRI